VAAAVEVEVEVAPELPERWTELSDPSTGKVYFHNADTNEATWERPAPVLADHIGENATGKLYGGAKGWAKERGAAKFTPQHRVVSARLDQVGSGGSAAGDDDKNGPATYIRAYFFSRRHEIHAATTTATTTTTASGASLIVASRPAASHSPKRTVVKPLMKQMLGTQPVSLGTGTSHQANWLATASERQRFILLF
jgi:hypothetical protein